MGNIQNQQGQGMNMQMGMGSQEVPTGVKVISVLGYILFGVNILFILFYLVLGIMFVINPNFDFNFVNIFGQNQFTLQLQLLLFIGSIASWMFFVAAIIGIPVALLIFFIARGLRRGKKWTRIIVIVFSILWAVSTVITLVSGGNILVGIFALIIYGLIAGYLLFSKKVKEAFA